MKTEALVEIDYVDKVFALPNGKHYVALKDINFVIEKGEFVSLIGHSGCGKSTLLRIVAGLDQATIGGVVLAGKEVDQPGPDRMVVFQHYSLLPWKTVYQNVALAVDTVFRRRPASERREIIEQHLDWVGLLSARAKYPHELSGGMKQRVAIARALALRPKLLLLDEPFGALDALTRAKLQERLMQICEESHTTCLMVTHDVDEALLLSDRIVMLTNGPESRIGRILTVPMAHPRRRLEVVNHPSYYALRNDIIYFLNQQKRAKRRQTPAADRAADLTVSLAADRAADRAADLAADLAADTVQVGPQLLTTPAQTLTLGFIPLTDCAPFVVAQEKGLFKKHGLEQVSLSREPSWRAITDGVVSGRLQAAQMVAGMPIALTLGIEQSQPVPIVTGLVLSRSGNAITLSQSLYAQGVRTAADLKASMAQTPDQTYTLGMVHPASMHNLLLRYWLAASNIDPDKDLSLIQIPPPQMVATLKAGNIDGYCVGEPWNSRAVNEGLGSVVATSLDLWPGHPEKVLGLREDYADQHPETHIALIEALIEACDYCDNPRNRLEILGWLAQPEYVGVDPAHLRPGFLEGYRRTQQEEPEMLPRFNQFSVNQTNCPSRGEAIWIMTQLARWGITPFPKNWVDTLARIRRLDIFNEAARAEGKLDVEPTPQPFRLFDGQIFDPNDPISYLNNLEIKRDVRIEEIDLN